ncbi:MAG: hypothetical protein M1815_003053 [Lichina confinis]|nr:MAG: hypothetical protein M1815_003053 [Lichina confinis]
MVHPTQPRYQVTGLRTWTVRPKYQTYQSPFAPGYKQNLNIHGVTLKGLGR